MGRSCQNLTFGVAPEAKFLKCVGMVLLFMLLLREGVRVPSVYHRGGRHQHRGKPKQTNEQRKNTKRKKKMLSPGAFVPTPHPLISVLPRRLVEGQSSSPNEKILLPCHSFFLSLFISFSLFLSAYLCCLPLLNILMLYPPAFERGK